ncbi:putative transferase [Medicago truncatula]|uniref:Putative transferase n=1 Tax=Medicago truncatula TaxID=3880 RepID=A0A396GKK6_MEDTR|nr:putative transferase [Medicago truncatula]
MEIFLHFVLVLLGALTILVLIQAQDQSGFISIDCGIPENSNYSDNITSINYISDAEFIRTGVRMSIAPAEKITHQQQLHFVRSFPSGVRNCYRINVNMDIQYLIRATFYYGNYDNLNDPPQFDLHFGPNVWDTVKFTNLSRTTIKEIIYTPSLDYIEPCLVNTGNGTPFISVIELRTLNNSNDHPTYSASPLSLVERFDIGSTTGKGCRYKDDVHDRMWSPYELSSDWRRLSTSLNSDDLDQNYYKLPAIVMSTAVTPVNASAPLQFHLHQGNVYEQYYIIMHFNEVEELAENETRSFNITVNGKFLYGPVIPVYRSVDTFFSRKPLTGAKRYKISLFRTEDSTLPPILNAFEFYKLNDISGFDSLQDDVDTITNIKNAYGVERNWQGDPCYPEAYMWEGLNCSMHYLIGGPRILSLDLSNNSLNGPLPDSLMQLQSLKVLNVGKNQLRGIVPTGLLERSKNGSLSLRYFLSSKLQICQFLLFVYHSFENVDPHPSCQYMHLIYIA